MPPQLLSCILCGSLQLTTGVVSYEQEEYVMPLVHIIKSQCGKMQSCYGCNWQLCLQWDSLPGFDK